VTGSWRRSVIPRDSWCCFNINVPFELFHLGADVVQTKLVANAAIHDDRLAFQDTSLHPSVLEGRPDHDDVPQNARFTADGYRLAVDGALNHHVPEHTKNALRGSQDGKPGMTATT
jgi:hypothetical protein